MSFSNMEDKLCNFIFQSNLSFSCFSWFINIISLNDDILKIFLQYIILYTLYAFKI